MEATSKYEPKDIATALDAPPDVLDAGERKFVSIIREHGWHLTNVFADEENLGFAYSTGIWLKTGFPEIVAFSLKQQNVHAVLWDIFRGIQSGNPPPIGKRAGIFADLDGVLLPCAKSPHYRELFGWSRWFYGGDDFECVQLVWPDTQGRFPWERGFEQGFRDLQPDLTEHGWTAALAN
jgi:hypothetical protein